MKVRVEVDGRAMDVSLEETDEGLVATVDGHAMPVRVRGDVVRVGDRTMALGIADAHTAVIDGRTHPFRLLELHGVAGAGGASGGLGDVKPPMTGKLDSIEVREGQEVESGDVLFVLEAMKMRNEVRSPADGVVTAIHAAPGDAIDTSTTVMVLGPKA